MRAYVAVTGVLFALVTLAHVARTSEILTHLPQDPGFVAIYSLLTALCAALAVWAWRLWRRLPAA